MSLRSSLIAGNQANGRLAVAAGRTRRRYTWLWGGEMRMRSRRCSPFDVDFGEIERPDV